MISLQDLSAVDIGAGRSFVMSRTNGRWVVLANERFAQLHQEASQNDAESQSLVAELMTRGVLGPAFRPPSHLNTLILKITKVCNYACTYCYDLEDTDAMVDISLETANAAVDQALEVCQAPRTGFGHTDLGVILHGGEPTLRFGLIKQIVLNGEQTARRLGKKIGFSLQSNLSRLTPDMVEFSTTHNITWGVSLDGPPSINDHLRVLKNGAGTYGHFERALQAYPDFVRSCGVLTTITSNTDSRLLEIAEHFRDVGMPSWKWSLFQPIGAGRGKAKDLSYTTSKVIAAWNELLAAVEAGHFDGFEVGPVLDYLTNMITGPGPDMCKRNGCGAGRDLVSVSSDGTLEACDCIDRKGPLAGIGLIQIQTKNSILEALNSEKAKSIRSRAVADVPTLQCAKCTWLALCGGTCLAHAGALDEIDTDWCDITMNAYNKLAHSMSASDRLRRYWNTVRNEPATAGNA